MEETPKSYKWLWWLLGGIAALATGFAAWFFFFKGDDKPKDETKSETKDETKVDTKADTKADTTKVDAPEKPSATEPVKQNTNPPPKTPQPKGDIWNDIFVGSKSNKLRTTNKRSLKLVQTATNEVLKKSGRKNLTCGVDGVWGPKTQAAVSAALGVIFTPGPTHDLLKYKESAGGYTVSTYLSNAVKYLSGGKYEMGDMNGLKVSIENLTDVQKAIILKQ